MLCDELFRNFPPHLTVSTAFVRSFVSWIAAADCLSVELFMVDACDIQARHVSTGQQRIDDK